MSDLSKIPKGRIRNRQANNERFFLDDRALHDPEYRKQLAQQGRLEGQYEPYWDEIVPPISREEFQASKQYFPIVNILDELTRLREAGLNAGYDFDLIARRYYILGGTSYTINPDGTDLKYSEMFTVRYIQDKWIVDKLNDEATHQEFAQLHDAVDAVIACYQVAGVIAVK